MKTEGSQEFRLFRETQKIGPDSALLVLAPLATQEWGSSHVRDPPKDHPQRCARNDKLSQERPSLASDFCPHIILTLTCRRKNRYGPPGVGMEPAD